MRYKIALVGNPNCGKTTLFNELTGSNQYVGNWPGVTVEQKSGHLKHHENDVDIIDLPGIYSLSTYSLEEVITRDYIEKEAPDVIIDIIDAQNIERNLYLTLQLCEMDCPMVIALNMMDVLETHGDKLDVQKLSERLGIPVMPIIASKSEGVHELIHLALDSIGQKPVPPDIYSAKVSSLIDELERKMHLDVCRRMHAIRFIEEGIGAYAGHEISEVRLASLNELVDKRLDGIKTDRDMIIADEKYKFITKITSECLVRANKIKNTISDKIDRFVTNRVLAIPLFLLMMFLVFFIAFGPFGTYFVGLFENGIDYCSSALEGLLERYSVAPWAVSLVIDGIIGGVGSVLVILPQIAILFLMLSFLEDSGYMARAAFIMDRPLRKFGLSGRSFIPMLMGFGCTVPALMSARILENEKERRITMMITPFMSCGARFPVYALIANTFFKEYQLLAVYSMYLIGIVVAFISGFILKKTVGKGSQANFIMELPEYRMPTVKNLSLHTYEKIKDFVTKAGTVLVIAFVVIWVLQYLTPSLNSADDSNSILCMIGKAIAPVFQPLGFGSWEAASALLSGVVAKEAVAGTLSIVAKDVSTLFTTASAFSFMVFVLLYIPCVAAIATLAREMNSKKWTVFTIAYHLVTAWIVSFAAYRIALLFMI